MNIFGEPCPELGPRLFGRDPATGARYIDLFRINRLIAHKGPHLDLVRPFMTGGWRLAFDGPRTQRFVRILPNRNLPGTVSWVSRNTRLDSAGPARATAEQVQIARSGDRPTTIVFARLWWPGYEAEFGGEPLSVRAHRGIFAAVDVPAGAESGVLTLRFRPPYLSLGIAGLVGGFAIMLIVLGLPGLSGFAEPRRSRRSGARTTDTVEQADQLARARE
jgi:hypothetical protein